MGSAAIEGVLRIDAARTPPREAAALCRDLAIVCVQEKIERALLLVDADPASCLSVRDAATVMAMAGIVEGFRLALVTCGPRSAEAETQRRLEADLNRVGIVARAFPDEPSALDWLKDANPPAHVRGKQAP